MCNGAVMVVAACLHGELCIRSCAFLLSSRHYFSHFRIDFVDWKALVAINYICSKQERVAIDW